MTIYQTKIEEKTKVDEANHCLSSSMFAEMRSTFLKFQMRIFLKHLLVVV